MPNGGLHGDYGPELPQERETRLRRECADLIQKERDAIMEYCDALIDEAEKQEDSQGETVAMIIKAAIKARSQG